MMMGHGRSRRLTRDGNTLLYRWRTSLMMVDVGSSLDKQEKVKRKHMADTPASCSKPRVTVVAAPSLATKQLLKILKQSSTSRVLVEELRPGSARIVLRKLKVDRLMVLSNDVRSIHEMQWKSNLVASLSRAWPGTGDVPNNQLRALRAKTTKIRNVARPRWKASTGNAMSSTRILVMIPLDV